MVKLRGQSSNVKTDKYMANKRHAPLVPVMVMLGPVWIRHTEFTRFGWQYSHSVDLAGWQAKMASIEIWIPWRNAHKLHCLSFSGGELLSPCSAYLQNSTGRRQSKRCQDNEQPGKMSCLSGCYHAFDPLSGISIVVALITNALPLLLVSSSRSLSRPLPVSLPLPLALLQVFLSCLLSFFLLPSLCLCLAKSLSVFFSLSLSLSLFLSFLCLSLFLSLPPSLPPSLRARKIFSVPVAEFFGLSPGAIFLVAFSFILVAVVRPHSNL